MKRASRSSVTSGPTDEESESVPDFGRWWALHYRDASLFCFIYFPRCCNVFHFQYQLIISFCKFVYKELGPLSLVLKSGEVRKLFNHMFLFTNVGNSAYL